MSQTDTVQTQEVIQKRLREAFGSFATGVTIITTVTPEGQRIGLTANSFTSVSLEPPLVLWSLKKNSGNLEVFRNATHFAVNVLSNRQKDLCFRFASKVDGDRFDGIALEPSRFGLPLVSESLARFECSKYHEYEAGDHVMFLGKVEEFQKGEGEALIFSSGRILENAA